MQWKNWYRYFVPSWYVRSNMSHSISFSEFQYNFKYKWALENAEHVMLFIFSTDIEIAIYSIITQNKKEVILKTNCHVSWKFPINSLITLGYSYRKLLFRIAMFIIKQVFKKRTDSILHDKMLNIWIFVNLTGYHGNFNFARQPTSLHWNQQEKAS